MLPIFVVNMAYIKVVNNCIPFQYKSDKFPGMEIVCFIVLPFVCIMLPIVIIIIIMVERAVSVVLVRMDIGNACLDLGGHGDWGLHLAVQVQRNNKINIIIDNNYRY